MLPIDSSPQITLSSPQEYIAQITDEE